MDKRGLYMPPKVNACFTSKLKKKKEKKFIIICCYLRNATLAGKNE